MYFHMQYSMHDIFPQYCVPFSYTPTNPAYLKYKKNAATLNQYHCSAANEGKALFFLLVCHARSTGGRITWARLNSSRTIVNW